MGIRFFCPHCDRRLHVKEFLAGRKGICPHCDEGITIPAESTIGPETADQADPESPDLESETHPGTPSTVRAPRADSAATVRPARSVAIGGELFDAPEKPGAKPVSSARSSSGNAPSKTTRRGMLPSSSDESTSTSDVAIDLVTLGDPSDPIDAAPHLLWYVRPTSGGQYGPAEGTILRRWLAEGRVADDTLVWQEGWEEWREAREVFGSTAEGASAAAPAPPGPLPKSSADKRSNRAAGKGTVRGGSSSEPDDWGVPESRNSVAPLDPAKGKLLDYRLRRSRDRGRQWAAVIVLGLLCVGLVVALGFVLSRGL